MKEEYGTKLPYVRLVFVAMRRNIGELPKFVELGARLGMDEVKAVYLIVYHEKFRRESLVYHQKLANDIFGETEERARELGMKLTLPDGFNQKDIPSENIFRKPCYRPWEEFFIQSDGRVRGCNFSNDIMGDLNSQKFEEIWNGEHFQWYRRAVNSSQPPLDCQDCQHFRHINVNNINAHIKIATEIPGTY